MRRLLGLQRAYDAGRNALPEVTKQIDPRGLAACPRVEKFDALLAHLHQMAKDATRLIRSLQTERDSARSARMIAWLQEMRNAKAQLRHLAKRRQRSANGAS